MFTIGEFARLGQVSPRMLRHYDETGLLRPTRVDPQTGYRLYDVGELGRLHRLLALRDLGSRWSRSVLCSTTTCPSSSAGHAAAGPGPNRAERGGEQAACAVSKPTSERSKGAPPCSYTTSSSSGPNHQAGRGGGQRTRVRK